MFLYDYDALRVPARRTSHQLIVRADQLIRRNHVHIIGKKKDKIVCQELSLESSEESGWMLVVLVYGITAAFKVIIQLSQEQI